MKKAFWIFVVAAGLFIFAGESKAQNQNFSMTNNTGMILVDVFVSPIYRSPIFLNFS